MHFSFCGMCKSCVHLSNIDFLTHKKACQGLEGASSILINLINFGNLKDP